MDTDLEAFAKRIRSRQADLNRKAEAARSSDPTLFRTIAPEPLSLSVCAVDGGLLSSRIHGSDIVLVRSVGVHFNYQDSALISHSYHPSRSVTPMMRMHDGLDEHESNVFRSLVRLQSEISLAIDMVLSHTPDMLLLDGSIWLVPSDRPSPGSPLSESYHDVVSLHKKLFSICDEKGVSLCGVVKDSRSSRLSRSLGEDCSDSVLLSYALSKGEATAQKPYFEEPQKEPEGFWGRMKYFYLRPSDEDLPLRIEYLDSGKDPSGILLSLSGLSPSFAYPAILVEADMRAAMDPREMEAVNGLLMNMGLSQLRRNSRPFR